MGNSTLLGLFTHPNFINDESCTILVVGATARRAKGALFSNNTSPENVPNYQVRVGNLNLQAGQCKPGQCRPDKCKFKFSALTWAIGAFYREGFLAIKKSPPLAFLPIVLSLYSLAETQPWGPCSEPFLTLVPRAESMENFADL